MPATKKRGAKARRARTAKRGKVPFLKVTSPRQYPQLKKMMNGCKIMFVYVGEPWCGFCNKFEPDFKEMVASKKRNMPVVSIKGSVLNESPLGSMMQADGYPTVAIVAPKQNASYNLPSRDPEVIRTVTENAPSLTPPDSSQMNDPTMNESESPNNLSESVNNLINKSREAPISAPLSMGNSMKPSAKLFEEVLSENIKTDRPSSRFTPVTVDSNPPPLSENVSEEEYLKKREPNADMAMKQLGGSRSLWDALHGR
jgi:hypothetical protein